MTRLSANSIEMRALYREYKGGDKKQYAEDMEVAMAATIFRDLQKAGYIPEDAEMADSPPCKSDSVEGSSYEAILVELIGDKDRDGKFDIDLDELVDSGIVHAPNACITGNTLVAELEGHRDALSDGFLRAQDSASDLSQCDIFCIGEDLITDKGERVQEFSENMLFTSNIEHEIEGVSSRLGYMTGSEVATQTVLRAQVLREKGDASSSRRLLAGTMDQLIVAGEYDAAETIAKELQSAALKDEEVSTVVDHQHSWVSRLGNIGNFEGGNTTYTKPHKHMSTLGEVGADRVAQIDMARTMAAAVSLPEGETFNPWNSDHATAYFQTRVDAGASTEALGNEFHAYLETFYNHSGKGVTWDKSMALDDRAANVDELMSHQINDLAGRKIVDCEGYAYLNEKIIGGLKDEDGEQMFDIRYMSTTNHVIGGAFEKNGDGGFSVNNDTVTHLPASEGGYSESDYSGHMRDDIDSEHRYKIWYGSHASCYDSETGTRL